ncbi:tRNA (adenosine(37)-N6)-threonylcarbamoyltransferase complex ATPase subunit type 1 TsaE [Candidatus Giovannonibacteria bacterium RIFCSPLOWO2_12_FULL_43_11c]|uniref:tRNA threonylcarbamoyladenosine biosynthesis protein TsaE n=1 Tax=Candidatus Giovannonibacteria bacterium RIFCSPHIGHO2_12_FULL_43_15 TaxID=1798341 RepID=A0A1F5WPM8_9BACT|nr:MAG: tRNA (adenosine(37)-N6)-threonylcarbamoyltransferase complex ATPase subunit type 1 TsaE [Candidatus Giovannonibacteria bacterium RIFCSPHIGHO2_01_FULL_43_100]OGF66761.1 MAG: tRNA (adenosine(37)-N6)-threonylcarbamoyltransferase complex ATPase subunit type 1 TsaE [Candidatus Giovannonibacteria bacterium RIFCSPHIGHO2_02_FULL_43_32]OGF77537.1 MAG: tRNA (adenosine(37)-N6)-threonylcarbamoyltransferase complex ATPase subunit type 1 TsaE [Candidatus Giovannonibacteria bacterium RIFCSPHIGHO2_12_FUL
MKEALRAITKNAKQTEKFAEAFAREVLRLKTKRAILIGLEGELGAGKTTFAKGFARGLGIKEEMKSPTFILMRVFRSSTPTFRRSRTSWERFFHIDAYRDQIDFREYLKSKKNILLVEWSDKAKKFLPKNYFRFVLRSPTSKTPRSRTSREIKFYV